ncbi:hypothetical protein BK673_11490 [Pseudomonas fluorescens]|jgi:hypothetical protein|uniref:Uncharacterized protein n=1 Tax=Pseudomonas fluorescens TaxID=294 RepID=A0A423P7E7_PSEFL|nr:MULTISPECIES: hypothetical protein [Pseudomonas fluorescens group]OOH76544.1 hypothetical protein BOW65_22990 [Pseudomonas koreensis]ROO10369.1 hypothetical protein BK673_11490 [Pseudomonas fluorescens]WRH91548.1 hypothetical protein RCC30_23755 [Pseudomonas fluorescens]
MTNPKAYKALFAFGSLEIDVKGVIDGIYLDLISYKTSATSISFSPLTGYLFDFHHNYELSSRRALSIGLSDPLSPTGPGYSEHVVSERSGLQIYEFALKSTSTIAVTKPSPNLYRYEFKDFKTSGKARHNDDTRELTINGLVVVQELPWPL